MNTGRTIGLVLALLLATVASAQSWSEAYGRALEAVKAERWLQAREAFQQAIASRPDDFSAATNLPGPITERRRWRGGAPYSPNFGAAYAGFKAAQATQETEQRRTLLTSVAEEFEALLRKGQNSRETFFFLNQVYTTLGNSTAVRDLETRLQALQGRLTWRVDNEILTPEEAATIAMMGGETTEAQPGTGGQPTTGGRPPVRRPTGEITPEQLNQGNETTPGTTIAGRVPMIANKFALIVGNGESRLDGGAIPFASNDASDLRQTLIESAGYPEANVDMVMNATAEQILASARALAERMPDSATLLIYFTGAGTHLDGKDYLAGVDAEISTDTTRMVAKSELLGIFLSKGARIFCFFQVNRPIVAGRYFGMEVAQVGAISQMQATVPGESVLSVTRDGRQVGVFTHSMVTVLQRFRSNRIPVMEFAWQVFDRIRSGGTGNTGGGSRQVPTLPVLTNMASDARF